MYLKNTLKDLVNSDIIRIFAPMREEDRKLIQGLLNHDENVGEMFYECCKATIWGIINKYYEKRWNKTSLYYELSNEFYLYIINNPKILQGFKGRCNLKGYLASVAYHYFSSYKFDIDPAIQEANKERKELEEREEKMIRRFDNEPENFRAFKPSPIPTEFRDEDEDSAASFLIYNIDNEKENDKKEEVVDDIYYITDELDEDYDDEKDVIVDIDEIINSSSDAVYTDKCKLVRQTLEQMPPRQAILYQLQYFEGIEDSKELAKRLGITIGALYNLRKEARKSFIYYFNQLKKQQYEEN